MKKTVNIMKNNLFLMLSGAFAFIHAGQAAAPETSYMIEQGAPLPPAAVKAADSMVAKESGGFSVGLGVRDKVTSLAHFGGIQPDTQYPIASASKFLAAGSRRQADTASTAVSDLRARWCQGRVLRPCPGSPHHA